jgi:hypothetical protein
MMTEPGPSTGPRPSARWIIAGIMLVLVLWGAYLARGSFLLQRNVLQGALVLICVLAFLAFWGAMLWSQNRGGESRYSTASIAGFTSGLVALLLTIPIDLSTQFGNVDLRLDLSRPGLPLFISAVLLGLSVLLSIIGLSRPQPLVGKNLGLFALPFAVAWLYLAVRLASAGS